MIHTNRTVTVGNQESIIDSPIILYRGDREVEVEFTLNGNKFTFTNGGNVIKSTNATHGQLVINTPTGENMFSEVTECNEGKVVFLITKEMIDELVEVGFYSFQIRLFDESQVSRVTIPPVFQGIDIRNPIAAEDETNVVDIGLVDYAIVQKDEYENLATFLPDGSYNKTDWESRGLITEAKLDKIEDALYTINENMEASDLSIFNRLESINQNVNRQITEFTNEADAEIEAFERSVNTNVEQFKIDTNAAMTAHKNEVSEELESVNEQLEYIENSNFIDIRKYDAIPNTDCTDIIQKAVDENKRVLITEGTYYINPTKAIRLNTGNILCIDSSATLKAIGVNTGYYQMIALHDIENAKVFGGGTLIGEVDEHLGGTGQHGMGISIRGANNCEVSDLNISKCWGDGVYIGSSYNEEGQNYCEFITVRNLRIKECRRQGISIISVKNTLIENIDIKDIAGTDPQDGIDIEPNHPTEFLQNITMRNISTQNCAGSGIKFYAGAYKDSPNIVNIKIENHTDIGSAYGFRVREDLGTTKGIIEAKGCRWINSRGHNFYAQEWNADAVQVKLIKPIVQASSNSNYAYAIALPTGQTNSTLNMGGVSFYEPSIIANEGINPDRGIYIDGSSVSSLKNIDIINPLQLLCTTSETQTTFVGTRENCRIIDDYDTLTYTIPSDGSQQYSYNNWRFKKKIISQRPDACININGLVASQELEIVNDADGSLTVRFYNLDTDAYIYPLNTKMAPLRTNERGARMTVKRLGDGNAIITNMVGNWAEI